MIVLIRDVSVSDMGDLIVHPGFSKEFAYRLYNFMNSMKIERVVFMLYLPRMSLQYSQEKRIKDMTHMLIMIIIFYCI